MPLDHLVYGAHVLDHAVDDLAARLGVRAVAGGRHEGVGTHNALLSLGDGAYLELIAPDPTQPEPALPRPFGLDGLQRPGLVGWAWRCDDIDGAVARARRAGYDPGDAAEMTRATTDGRLLRWRLTANARGGGLVPFLIAWGDTPHPSATAPAGLTLVSFRIEHPERDAVASALAALGLDVPVAEAGQPALVAVLDGPRGRVELR